jgi:hypothetical protein
MFFRQSGTGRFTFDKDLHLPICNPNDLIGRQFVLGAEVHHWNAAPVLASVEHYRFQNTSY